MKRKFQWQRHSPPKTARRMSAKKVVLPGNRRTVPNPPQRIPAARLSLDAIQARGILEERGPGKRVRRMNLAPVHCAGCRRVSMRYEGAGEWRCYHWWCHRETSRIEDIGACVRCGSTDWTKHSHTAACTGCGLQFTIENATQSTKQRTE